MQIGITFKIAVLAGDYYADSMEVFVILALIYINTVM
jgi:hypothetical protein